MKRFSPNLNGAGFRQRAAGTAQASLRGVEDQHFVAAPLEFIANRLDMVRDAERCQQLRQRGNWPPALLKQREHPRRGRVIRRRPGCWRCRRGGPAVRCLTRRDLAAAAAVAVARAGAPALILNEKSPGSRARTDEMERFRFNRGPHAVYLGGAGRADRR